MCVDLVVETLTFLVPTASHTLAAIDQLSGEDRVEDAVEDRVKKIGVKKIELRRPSWRRRWKPKKEQGIGINSDSHSHSHSHAELQLVGH